MQDLSRELGDLRKEVVEARNQAIKTDNQVKNLTIDVKAFDKRFDLLERRTRMASLGANVLVAAVILVAAYMVHSTRVGNLNDTVAESTAAADKAKKEAAERVARIEQQMAALEKAETRRAEAERAIGDLLKALDAGQEKQAEKLVEGIDLAAAGTLVTKLAEARVKEFRRKVAEGAHKNGKNLVTAGKTQAGIIELERAVALDPDGRYATPSRYIIATTLWKLGRFDEVVPVLREMRKHSDDRAIIEDVTYLLGTSLARLGRKDEAMPILKDVVNGNGRFAALARPYLTSLEGGTELPQTGQPAVAAKPATAPRPPPPPPQAGQPAVVAKPVSPRPPSPVLAAP
jgi:tetratricopeptide (TPR) repeat protein